MKINEKNLCAYSISTSHIDKEGYLLKKGEVNKSFQRRWFVLKGNLLFYFDKKGDKEPVGVVILEGCTIELAECEDQYTFKLVFHGGGGRTYVLAADSQEALECWMKALARASYDYLKLMVAELQKQLEEINAEESFQGRDSNGEEISDTPRPPPRQRQNPFNRPENMSNVSQDAGMRGRANTVSHTGDSAITPSNSSSNVSPRSSSNRAIPITSPPTPSRTAPLPPVPQASSTAASKRLAFAQLHSEYGIPILRDKELHQKGMLPKMCQFKAGSFSDNFANINISQLNTSSNASLDNVEVVSCTNFSVPESLANNSTNESTKSEDVDQKLEESTTVTDLINFD